MYMINFILWEQTGINYTFCSGVYSFSAIDTNLYTYSSYNHTHFNKRIYDDLNNLCSPRKEIVTRHDKTCNFSPPSVFRVCMSM